MNSPASLVDTVEVGLDFDKSPNPLFIADADGRIIYANAATVRRYGYSMAELLGMPAIALAGINMRAHHRQNLRKTLTEPCHFEWVHRRKDGSEFPVETNTRPVVFRGVPGVRIATGAIVETVSGAININGSGMNGTDSNYGVLITDAFSAVKSASGAVSVAGSSWGTGVGNYGVYVDAGGTVATDGTARLLADHDIYLNSALTNTTGGSLVLNADINGTGVGTVTFGASGSIALSGGGRTDLYYNPLSYTDAATKSDALTNPYTTNITGPYTAWMLVNDLPQLQGLNANLVGNYALGKDIAAYAATPSIAFSGRFDGQSHIITGLTSSLFGSIDVGAAVSNVGLVGSALSAASTSNVGALAGINYGTISNSYVSSGSVSGSNFVGGLVGSNYGSIDNSYVTGSGITGWNDVGGLAGSNYGNISNSYFTGGGVSGSTNVGGLVGSNFASISNSYVSGGTVSGWNNVGGLAGLNEGGAGGSGGAGMTSAPGTPGAAGSNATISNSYVSGGSVSGYSNVGGLVGLNAGGAGGAGGSGTSITAVGGAGGAGGSATISNSYVDGGTVVSGNNRVGGLVGNNSSGATGSMGTGLYGGMGGAGGAAAIGNSYVSGGIVTGTNTWTGTVGGLAGYNSGSISNTYVTGGTVASAASDSGWVGGLVGNNLGTVTTSYASTGVVATRVGGSPYGFGGLVGGNTGSVTDSFWDVDTSGQALGMGDNSAGATGIYSSTPTVNAFTQATYTGFDFGNTWWMSDGNTRPFLRSEWNNNIINAHQLQLMGMNLSASYTLGANIDMVETAALSGMWGSGGFVPVGYYTSYVNNAPFIGQFDGQNFTISNLTINRSAESYVGLFGYSGAALRNVGLLDVTVNGGGSVGALVGYSYAVSQTATRTIVPAAAAV
ncbi:MAG: PAS domain S-box protein [Nitrosomonadales bacterium]|nr:PAS domain S-box protein [Nitrosomonadales bacterium]